MARIVVVTEIARDIETVFDLARNIDAHTKSASQTSEQAIAGRTTGLAELGDEITWRAKHFGIWQNLTVRITAMDRPNSFTDEMVRGAFKSMRHRHRFEQVGETTRMTDEFEFAAPFGPLGRVAEVLFLTGYMRAFLMHRNAELKAMAESDAT